MTAEELRASIAANYLPEPPAEFFEGWSVPDQFEPGGRVMIEPNAIRGLWRAGMVVTREEADRRGL